MIRQPSGRPPRQRSAYRVEEHIPGQIPQMLEITLANLPYTTSNPITLARELVSILRQYAHNYSIRSGVPVDEIEGYLIAVDSSTGTSFGGGESLAEIIRIAVDNPDEIRLTNFRYALPMAGYTPDVILEVLSQAQQSNYTLEMSSLDWTFIIDPTSFLAPGRGLYGAAGRVPDFAIYKNAQGIDVPAFPETWDEQYYEPRKGVPVRLSCITFAICRALSRTDTNPLNKKFHSAWKNQNIRKSQSFNKKVSEMMNKLGINADDHLEKIQLFVDAYPEYRVAVINPKFRVTSANVFTGKDYILPEILKHNDNTADDSSGFTLYLFMQYSVTPGMPGHIGLCRGIATVIRRSIGVTTQYRFCHGCLTSFSPGVNHNCGIDQRKGVKRKMRCFNCKSYEHTTGDCSLSSCRVCQGMKTDQNAFNHRCIVADLSEPKEFNETLDKKNAGLFVFDFESRVNITESSVPVISDFITNDDNIYPADMGTSIAIYSHEISEHIVNLACLRNVFTGEEFIWDDSTGANPVAQMIEYLMSYNNGNNYVIAHNFSGYDGRLLYTTLNNLNFKVSSIMKGAKFMSIRAGSSHSGRKTLIFHDSLLHVKGSLRNLAREYGSGTLLKGHFPHLFNKLENYDYIGPIPDLKYFDLPFSIKNDKELDEFINWHSNFKGDWCFKDQLREYCLDDVRVLATVVKGYHENCIKLTGSSPWFKATAPSFCHQYSLRERSKQMELAHFRDTEFVAEVEKFSRESWAVLKPQEYWFARQALRGGRTDVRHIYKELSDYEWEQGLRIRYQDIVSQYPYQQVVHDFPVGYPTIHVYDPDFKPCFFHHYKPKGCADCKHNFNLPTGCEFKFSYGPQATISLPTEEEMMSDDFFGIVCVTWEAPKNLFHPVLVSFNTECNKSMATLRDEDLVAHVSTTPEFKTALKAGYKILKFHRFDKYTRKPSFWRDCILKFYVEKLINSKNAPSEEDLDKLCSEYNEAYPGVGDDIRQAVNEKRFAKNPSLKQTAKIMMNSMWGKHAQRPIQPKNREYDWGDPNEAEEIRKFFCDLYDGTKLMVSMHPLTDTKFMCKYIEKREGVTVDFSSGYIPAALFVPAYGRLQLWEQLSKLGDRVLMNDTDSIVYIYDPTKYNIPEGDMLGDWEVEDIDRDNGGIRIFVGVGPKSYAIKCNNGITMLKAKGISIKHAHQELLNFDVMRDMILTHLAEEEPMVRYIPQLNFKWQLSSTMKTVKSLKKFLFHPDELKGDLRGTVLYPFGHE